MSHVEKRTHQQSSGKQAELPSSHTQHSTLLTHPDEPASGSTVQDVGSHDPFQVRGGTADAPGSSRTEAGNSVQSDSTQGWCKGLDDIVDRRLHQDITKLEATNLLHQYIEKLPNDQGIKKDELFEEYNTYITAYDTNLNRAARRAGWKPTGEPGDGGDDGDGGRNGSKSPIDWRAGRKRAMWDATSANRGPAIAG